MLSLRKKLSRRLRLHRAFSDFVLVGDADDDAKSAGTRTKRDELNPEEIVAQVVADLERQRMLDDREFARRFVEARLARANGSRQLAKELRRNGVGSEIIDEILEEFEDELDSNERAVELLGKQAWRYRGLECDKAKRRMLGFLARRGYDTDMAHKAVDQVWQELADEVEGN